jgi:hypothetical protein
LADKEGDFVVTRNRRVQWLIEVRTSHGAIGSALNYYAQKLRPKDSLQLVLDLERAQEKSGVKIVPLAKWLEALPFESATR